jgi:ATP-dependent DNA helicase RecQ
MTTAGCDNCKPHIDTTIAAMAGAGAAPRDDQRAAVHELVCNQGRVLVVQATGWGKSAVYWSATVALRANGAGCTLIVSPLLALMRDQVAAATAAGLNAATINSSNVDDWDDILTALRANELDALLVSPERLANPKFAATLPDLLTHCGLLVQDEAHCISDWGHDFRPDYQRLSNVLLRLNTTAAVLATTATANERVTTDVAAQLGTDTVVLRGSLARASLRLGVQPALTPTQRYAWVADTLGNLAGSGIVYALTVAETERLAGFLVSQGHHVAAYSSALTPDERQHLEDQLRTNDIKALVATSALGMGYDKPDIGFVVHVGSPASPVSYYQQIGRAGRALDDAVAVLLPADNDERLWEYFATAGIPDPAHVTTLLDALDTKPHTVVALETATGLRRGRIEALLKLLAVTGHVDRDGSSWHTTGTPYRHDHSKWDTLAEVRRVEAQIMREYAAGRGCLMQHLQTALDDPDPAPCGRCSTCTGSPVTTPAAPDHATVAAAQAYLRGVDVILEPRQLWPAGTNGYKGRIDGPAPGRALAFADDPGWIEDLPAAGIDGPLDDNLARGVIDVLRRFKSHWPQRPVAVVAIPSRNHPQRVASMANIVAAAGKLPMIDAFTISGPVPAHDTASAARANAIIAGLRLRNDVTIPDARILLIDDTTRTGWTLTVAATLLRAAGSGAVYPVVLHKLP